MNFYSDFSYTCIRNFVNSTIKLCFIHKRKAVLLFDDDDDVNDDELRPVRLILLKICNFAARILDCYLCWF